MTSVGMGEKLDPLQIGVQLFVMLALFSIASTLADTIMQTLFSERRHYREYKTELSPDFSDVRAKVEQLEKQSQSRQAKANTPTVIVSIVFSLDSADLLERCHPIALHY